MNFVTHGIEEGYFTFQDAEGNSVRICYDFCPDLSNPSFSIRYVILNGNLMELVEEREQIKKCFICGRVYGKDVNGETIYENKDDWYCIDMVYLCSMQCKDCYEERLEES